jgi:hypothetical protein
MDKYEDFLLFECTFHNVFIYPCTNKKAETTMLPLCITEEDSKQGIA